MFIRFILDAITAWKGLLSGDGSYFAAIVKAQFAFLKWSLFHPKVKSNSPDPGLILKGFLQKSLVWQYFIKKKKTFLEIVSETNSDYLG